MFNAESSKTEEIFKFSPVCGRYDEGKIIGHMNLHKGDMPTTQKCAAEPCVIFLVSTMRLFLPGNLVSVNEVKHPVIKKQ